MAKGTKVRLSDIAERLGVSTVTVSKAMAGKEGVSAALRQQIQDAAAQMGYVVRKGRRRRSDCASTVAPGGTGNIGIVAPMRFFDAGSGSFYSTLYSALSRAMQESGYFAIIEQLSAEDERGMNLPRVVRDGKVDGVILMGQVSEEYARYFAGHYSSFVFLDFYIGGMQVDSVVTDNFHMEYLLTQHLIDLGHRDIRFVGSFNRTSSVNDRFMGFIKAMLENGLRVSLDDIIPDCDAQGSGIPLALPEVLPTAFVCNCDECAVRLVNDLRARGLSVPGDVSVVGFDDFIHSPYDGPALTTVALDFDAISRAVLDILFRKIAGQPYNQGYTVVYGKLVLRDSVRRLN